MLPDLEMSTAFTAAAAVAIEAVVVILVAAVRLIAKFIVHVAPYLTFGVPVSVYLVRPEAYD